MENPALSSYLHLGTGIVSTLQRYGPVTIPFLAKTLRRRPEELEPYLAPLREKGVITQDGEKISIMQGEPLNDAV
jgi:hypothetical protein